MPLRAEIDQAKQQLEQMRADYQQALQQAQQFGMQPPPVDQEAVNSLTKLAMTKFSWEDISGVLRSDERRCYSVAVETDQTAFVDEESDKQNRTAFFTTVMQSLQQIAPMIAGNPKSGEIFKQLVMFVISAFKAGRSLEEGIEEAIDGAIAQAGQQGQEPQDPKAAIDAQIAQTRLQQAQIQLQAAQVGLQKSQIEAQGAGSDIQLEAVKTQQKAQQEAAKTQAINAQTEAKRLANQIELQNKAEKLQFDRQTRATAEEALLSGPTQKPSGA